jgi:lysophospholipase L1-like esterase
VKFVFLFYFFLLGFKVLGQGDISKSVIDSSKNMIQNVQNDKHWILFAQKVHRLKSERKGTITIVQLGDSHIQGGYFTNKVRELLNNQYGVAGRGLVFPYSLVNTNGPEDIKYYSSSKWTGQKYNLNIKDGKTSIAGYNLWANDTSVELSFALKQGSDTLFPFNGVVLYHNNPSLQVHCSQKNQEILNTGENNFYSTRLIFNTLLNSVQLYLSVSDTAKRRLAIYGIELVNRKPGIVYHSMGSNGTTYEVLSKSIDYLPMLKELHPDCIVISLGTNDAYRRPVDTLMLKKRITSVIDDIKKELPGTCILLTTPGDHLLDKQYPNPNLVKAQSAIIQAAREENCVFWDFFEVMGGVYSSKKWANHGLMYKDMVHLSKEGYQLEGELFFEALQRPIEK